MENLIIIFIGLFIILIVIAFAYAIIKEKRYKRNLEIERSVILNLIHNEEGFRQITKLMSYSNNGILYETVHGILWFWAPEGNQNVRFYYNDYGVDPKYIVTIFKPERTNPDKEIEKLFDLSEKQEAVLFFVACAMSSSER